MTKRRCAPIPVLALILILALPPAVAAGPRGGELARLAADLGDGELRFAFPAREGVCGCGDDIRIEDGPGYRVHHGDWDDDWDCECAEGPVCVRLKVRDGEIVRLRTRVGSFGRSRGREIRDLGELTSREAVARLLDLVRGVPRVAEDAIFPAYLAREVVIWPELLELARDRRLDEEVREQAVFWLGQIAGDKATEGLVSLAGDDDEALEVREMAVFALSQRDDGSRWPALSRIALESPHPELRRSALFWLAQSDDDRALELIERILTED